MGQGWGSVSCTVPPLRGPRSRTLSREEGGERRLCPPALPDAGSPLVSTWLSSLAVLKEGPCSLRHTMLQCHFLRRCPPHGHPGGGLQWLAGTDAIMMPRTLFTVFPDITLPKCPEVDFHTTGYYVTSLEIPQLPSI